MERRDSAVAEVGRPLQMFECATPSGYCQTLGRNVLRKQLKYRGACARQQALSFKKSPWLDSVSRNRSVACLAPVRATDPLLDYHCAIFNPAWNSRELNGILTRPPILCMQIKSRCTTIATHFDYRRPGLVGISVTRQPASSFRALDLGSQSKLLSEEDLPFQVIFRNSDRLACSCIAPGLSARKPLCTSTHETFGIFVTAFGRESFKVDIDAPF